MHNHKNGFVTILSIVILVLAFTLLMPAFEHPSSSHVAAKGAGLVLGAHTQSLPHEGEAKVITVHRTSFDKPLSVDARAFLVYDFKSGKVLFSQNIDEKVQIASLTKLMTAVVAMENENFSRPFTVLGSDQVQVAPRLGLKTGDVVFPADLLKAMLIGSANDAAVALANHLPNRTEFISQMNKKAQELGMFETKFSNPVGFDSASNYSTAADLKKLVEYLLLHLSNETFWNDRSFSFTSEEGTGYSIKNSNTLVFKHPEIKSIKTGQTPGASGSMIIRVANADGNEIVVIELGSSDRNSSALELVDYTFKNFSWK